MLDLSPVRALVVAPLAVAGCSHEAGRHDGMRSRSSPVGPALVEGHLPVLVGPIVAVGTDMARIRWTTDVPATTRLEYGLTPEYGVTVEDPALVVNHLVELSGLEDGTLYHFRFASADSLGHTSTSDGQTLETDPYVSVSGVPQVWFPTEIDVHGPVAHELDGDPNPFLDYRLVVRLVSPTGATHSVHGFFDGDGAGGSHGNVWRARFAPDEPGTWSYTVFFRAGPGVAVDLDLASGDPVVPHGETGSFSILGVVPTAPGFYRWGLLEYVGERYLKFRDGPYFLKGGTDSPENLLGYAGFDNTLDQPGGTGPGGLVGGVHRYESHVADFGPAGLGDASDPFFVSADTGFDSRGIVGALNYLASVHVNSVYFLPMNLGGDGRETYPFVGPADTPFDKTHYDVGKLTQWEAVLRHATRRGIALQFVLAETEEGNTNWLDDGALGVERKLFYREMVARFGHHLAIKWNLSEENQYPVERLEEFADYLLAIDPYDHPIAFHTQYLPPSGDYEDYDDVLGDPRFSATSIQGDFLEVGDHVDRWREDSEAAGHPWVVDVDEPGPSSEGLTDTNAKSRRRAALWDVYLNGGGIEWYAGSHDLPLGGDITLEDFRTREEMWNYMWYARKVVEGYPFAEMVPADSLVDSATHDLGGPEVLALANEVYLVYYPSTDELGMLDLSGTTGTFRFRWYDPRIGSMQGGATTQPGGAPLFVPLPPGGGGSGVDWLLIVDRP